MDPLGDNRITNPRVNEQGQSLEEVCERRQFLKTSVALGVSGIGFSLTACASEDDSTSVSSISQPESLSDIASSFNFTEIEHGRDKDHLVAPDHNARILIRWGDAMFDDSPEFDPYNQTPESQSKQFGYNNDYIGYLELEPTADQQARALLCVNHEYPQHRLMFPNFDDMDNGKKMKTLVGVSQASVGASVVEVIQQDGEWSVQRDSIYNRRISALDTEISIAGPAAGHPRMRTSSDPDGTTVIGTMGNCAGGMTPWGTYLSCEENVNFYFSGKIPKKSDETDNHERMNMPSNGVNWARYDRRFDVGKELNEANRFGWVVEIDPLDPKSKPKKRTALGRFKHEGAETVVSPNGQLVIYMGDDQRFEYLYKFVSRDRVNLDEPKANSDLLDHGTLYVAKFLDDGFLDWLPLSYENKLLATKRKKSNVANPRAKSSFGHIIELSELDGEFAGVRARWDTMVECGDPAKPSHAARWNPNTSENGWFASPDNGVVDPAGRLWISSDQGSKVNLSGTSDGLWALETSGAARGMGKMFFRAPMGAEVCGPVFSDNGESLFIAVQHPGEFTQGKRATFEKPSTRWPDFENSLPPRPSVMAIQKNDGGKVG